MVGKDADDAVVREEDAQPFLVFHGFDNCVRLSHEESQLGFRGSSIAMGVEVLFGVLG